MEAIAAIPAALGIGGGAATTGALIPAAAEAGMTGASVAGAGAGVGAGVGAGGMTLGAGLSTVAPLLGSLGKAAGAGADFLGKLGVDVPLSDVFGKGGGSNPPPASVPPVSSLAGLKSGVQFGQSLSDLFGGNKVGQLSQPATAPLTPLPAPPNPLPPLPSAATPTGGAGGYTPTATTLAQLMYQRNQR